MKKHAFLLVAAAAVALLAGCAAPRGNGPAPGNTTQQPGHVYGPNPGAPSSQQTGNTGQGNNAPPASNPSSQQASQPVKKPPRDPAEISSPAVMSLLGSADTLAKAGHMDASASTLERALDIEPRNPFVYQRLSAVRLAQGQAGQAEQMAMKSNSLAGDNPYVEAGNWRLIAEARRTSGNSRGASQANQRAVSFKQATSQYGQ